MTAWRVGVAIKPESTFGVEDTSEPWHFVGYGTDFTFTDQNGWKYQNGMGSKLPELQLEGRFSGTWNGNMYLDYANLYLLIFAMDGYGFKAETNRGVHIFTTTNNRSIKSFSLRFLQLDKTVGGPYDEDIVNLGCTINKFNPTYDSNNSGVRVSIGGSFVDQKVLATTVGDSELAYAMATRNNARPVEWGCLQVMNANDTAWEKIANNEQTGFTISRTVTTVPECGERVDTAFYESAIQPISVTSKVYARNGNQWMTRMHTGGIRNDITTGTTSRPRKKGLEPIPNIRIASSTIVGSDDGNSAETDDYVCIAQFEDIGVDSWGRTYNAGSEIVDNPSMRAMRYTLVIKTPDITSQLAIPTMTAVKVVLDFNDSGTTPVLEAYHCIGQTVNLPTPAINGFSGWEVSYTSGGSSATASFKGGEAVTLLADYPTDGVITFTAQY